MQEASEQAKVNQYAGSCPELASGVRITCQDAELHFETFIGFKHPLILSTIPYGHPPLPFSCIVSRSLLAKLCRAIARTGIAAITIDGTDKGIEIRSPDAHFCYRLISYPNPENFPVNRLKFQGIPCNIDIYQATTPEPTMITITNNYFQDLEAAITAGAIVKNGKNPKKADLYAAIAAYKSAVTPEPVEVNVATLEATGDEAALQDALLAMDAIEDAQPKPQKIKAPSKLDRLAQAIADGIEDIDQLAAVSGMKPQGVKGWVGVIRNRGVDNWKQACKKSA
ncbi:MAG: hypothetical protein DCF22_00570 [Leptolyngbya sp.]|nr:MAG: hypothetical protein DCF22_00570 [Leptolyngbya sp.]